MSSSFGSDSASWIASDRSPCCNSRWHRPSRWVGLGAGIGVRRRQAGEPAVLPGVARVQGRPDLLDDLMVVRHVEGSSGVNSSAVTSLHLCDPPTPNRSHRKPAFKNHGLIREFADPGDLQDGRVVELQADHHAQLGPQPASPGDPRSAGSRPALSSSDISSFTFVIAGSSGFSAASRSQSWPRRYVERVSFATLLVLGGVFLERLHSRGALLAPLGRPFAVGREPHVDRVGTLGIDRQLQCHLAGDQI